jgi:hypothetical protein
MSMLSLINVARRLREDVNAIASLTQFFYVKYSRKVVAPIEPYFDDQSKAIFKALISNAQTYLEYGSGGSTQLAARYAKTVISVDHDRAFLEAVGQQIYKTGACPEFKPIVVNIGSSGPWGYPVFAWFGSNLDTARCSKSTDSRLQRWKSYPIAPWKFLQQRMLEPDVILIDGRFRVACALESFLRLGPKSTCNILVDDYAGRPHYKSIEEFGDLVAMHGRMAQFRKAARLDVEKCRRVLEDFYRDFR